MARVTLASCPVPYKILYYPQPTLKGTGSGYTATLSFQTKASDQATFVQWAGGLPYVVGGVTRYIPLSHPDYPSLICTNIDSALTGSYTPSNSLAKQNWSDAKTTLTFTSVPWPTDGASPFLKLEVRGSGEVYTLAGSKYLFPSGVPIQADAGVTVPTIAYVATIYLCFALGDGPVATAMANPVNSDTFLGYAPGTVRIDGFAADLEMSAAGQQSYTRSLMFTWRPIPWNQFLQPNGIWDTPLSPSSATVYGTSALSGLLS